MNIIDTKLSLNELRDKAHLASKRKGFYDKPREVGTALMLTVSELSEALEADRKGRYADLKTFELCKKSPKAKDDPEYIKTMFEKLIKDTLQDEMADTVIRILDLCGHLNIDIEKHIELKMKYNETRERMHGKKY